MEQADRFVYLDTVLTPLALVVHPVDPSAQVPMPLGKIDVDLENSSRTAVGNSDGYRVFVGAPPGEYRVTVRSDRTTEYYLSKSFAVTLPSHGLSPDENLDLDEEVTLTGLPGALLAEVRLLPGAAYPFSTGATLVRIQVVEGAGGQPVPEVSIEVFDLGDGPPPPLKTVFRADTTGQSVLFCNRVSRTRIEEINGRPYEGSRQLRLRAVDPATGRQGEVDIEVVDFQTTTATIAIA